MVQFAFLLFSTTLISQPYLPDFSPYPGIPVNFPRPPSIVSVYDENQVEKPVPLDASPVLLWGTEFRVTVAGVQYGDKVIAYLNDEKVQVRKFDPFVPPFTLGINTTKLEPGRITALTVRVVRGDFTSAHSAPVFVLRLCKEPHPPLMVPAPPYKPLASNKNNDASRTSRNSTENSSQPIPIPVLVSPPIPHPPNLAFPQKDAFAFPVGPQVSQVPPPGALLPEKNQELDGMKPGEQEPSTINWVSNFPAPAQFPYPRFGPVGNKIEDEGVVIYEGMQFKAYHDGEFEIRFTASVPDMPVTLRLQLLVTTSTHPPFTLTLPPMEFIPPEMGFQGHYQAGNNLHRNYHVSHKGYSPMIAQFFSCLKGVHRDGTARFGSLPTSLR